MSPQAQYPINIQQLRHNLKIKWLTYYQQNYHWLEKMQIWGDYNGDRRPLSGFILATVAVLEPDLSQILPLIADLNNNPDQVIAALGLDFNPDKHLHLLNQENSPPFPHSNISDSGGERNHGANGNHQLNEIHAHSAVTRIISPLTKQMTNQNIHHENNENGYHGNGKVPISRTSTAVSISPSNQVMFKQSAPPTGKIIPTHSQPVANEVNNSAILSPRNLANWIDDFCQGRDWDPDEAVFIPF